MKLDEVWLYLQNIEHIYPTQTSPKHLKWKLQHCRAIITFPMVITMLERHSLPCLLCTTSIATTEESAIFYNISHNAPCVILSKQNLSHDGKTIFQDISGHFSSSSFMTGQLHSTFARIQFR